MKRSALSFTLSASVLWLGLLWTAPYAVAHEMRPAYLELREEAGGEFSVLWKIPARGEMRLALAPEFSIQTENMSPVVIRQTDDAAIHTWRLRSFVTMRGGNVRIAGLEGTMTDALVRFEFADGTSWIQRLTPEHPSALIPHRQTALGIAVLYIKLGIEHILSGIDHLLFILGLVFITRGGWNLLKTVSAFTVSHSLTLTAASLGWVHVPQPPVEAVIALSIVFVAAEIIHLYKGREGITSRAPWIVALTFGLLHGLGFAGVLSEIGLPHGHIPVALFFFSVGVETGHLLFVAAVLSLIALARRMRIVFPGWVKFVPPYAIGSIAMFWTIQRISLF